MLRRLMIATLACALAGVLTGCGEDPPPAAAPEPPPLHSFDLYVMASADGNIGFGDLYGITWEALTAHRITTGKRISTLSASRDTIVVAAADEQIDKLALVEDGGVLVPLPGLGRPHAFSPRIRPDGTIRFDDLGPEGESAITGRYRSYNPKTQRTEVLFSADHPIIVAGAVPNGLFLEVIHHENADAQVAVVRRNGDRTSYPVSGHIGAVDVGRRYAAIGVYSPTDPNAQPTDTVLLDLKRGKQTKVAGWVPLAWSPDRGTLLVAQPPAGNPSDPANPGGTALALVDPAHPDAPRPVGVIPGLALYAGSWVSGQPAGA